MKETVINFKRNHKVLFWIAAVFTACVVFDIVVLLSFGCYYSTLTPAEKAKMDADAAERDSVESVNHAYYMAQANIEAYLKKTLNNPKSYEPVEFSAMVKNPYADDYVMSHKFRATNGFGALMLTEYMFEVDKSGNVVGMLTDREMREILAARE